MYFILRDWTYQSMMKEINHALDIAMNDEEHSYAYKVGVLQSTLESVKHSLEFDEDYIGTTGVVWLKEDVVKGFEDNFQREPTKEELEDILENYIGLNGIGEGSAIEDGWDHINSALYDYERDNKEKFNAVQE